MIRQVELQDAKAITNIYNEYVLHSVATFDTEPVQEEEMRARIAEISSRFPYFVYEEDKEITGYCYAHTWKERSAYRYTLETTVYLSPGHTGKGIGMLLMQRLIEACRENGYRALIACITEGNEASNILHERLGFKQVSHFTKVGLSSTVGWMSQTTNFCCSRLAAEKSSKWDHFFSSSTTDNC